MKVIIAAGGTAGHIVPALALARTLRSRGADVTVVGTPDGQESRLVPEAGFAFMGVEARPLPRSSLISWPAALATTARAVVAARSAISGADAVVGMGGYASVPVGLAAALTGVPLVIHEQNSVAGLANRLLSRRAAIVALSFESSRAGFGPRVPVRLVGNPVREAVLDVAGRRRSAPDAIRAEAAAELGLDPQAPIVVVFGGSQGARTINRAALAAAPRLPSTTQLLLIAGRDKYEDVASEASGLTGVRVVAYLDRMELAYAVADVVVARAGATTCSELAVCGIPSVLVPYPHATDDHQLGNARELEVAGAASIVMDDRLDGAVFAERVGRLLADDALRASMGAAGRAWARPDASAVLAELVESVA